MKKIRIGIMGCADIAQRLMIPSLLQMPEQFEVAAIASRTKDKADDFASRFNCKSVEGYDNLLCEDIDAVYMPLPTGLHKEWISKTVYAGKHVYAEKSIAMNGKDAIEMVNEARKQDVALMEGYMFQYHKQHEIVRQLLSRGAVGDIRLIRASFGFPPFKDKSNFRYNNTVGGGALKDAAGYVWRCVNFLLGNCFEVKASNVFYDSKGTSIYGTAFAAANNLLSAEISFGFDNFYQCNYEIWGSKGKVTCLRAFTPKPNECTRIVFENQEGHQVIECEPYNHFIGAMTEFYNICINRQRREKHYQDIVFQANGLDMIEEMSRM